MEDGREQTMYGERILNRQVVPFGTDRRGDVCGVTDEQEAVVGPSFRKPGADGEQGTRVERGQMFVDVAVEGGFDGRNRLPKVGDTAVAQGRIGAFRDEQPILGFTLAQRGVHQDTLVLDPDVCREVRRRTRQSKPHNLDTRLVHSRIDSGDLPGGREPTVRADDQPTPNFERLTARAGRRGNPRD